MTSQNTSHNLSPNLQYSNNQISEFLLSLPILPITLLIHHCNNYQISETTIPLNGKAGPKRELLKDFIETGDLQAQKLELGLKRYESINNYV